MRVLVIADTHVGSTVGMLPKSRINTDFILNDVQSFLYDRWLSMCHDIGYVDAVICNGDMVDGLNAAEKGRETIPDMMLQCLLAKELISMINTKRFIFTQGSDYHTGANPSGDEMLCHLMNGEWLGTDGDLHFDNISIHVRHWQPYSKNPDGRYNNLIKELNTMALQEDCPDITIRSHTHRFNYAGNTRSLALSTPCWKGLDRYMRIKSTEIPDNGYILIDINGADFTWNQQVFNIPKKLFRASISG